MFDGGAWAGRQQHCAMIPRTTLRPRRTKTTQACASTMIVYALSVLICVAMAPSVTAFCPVAPSVAWGVRVRKVRSQQIIFSSATGETSAVPVEKKQQEQDYDPILSSMPWSDFQSWALRDNLHRYLVTIPSLGSSNPDDYETYALWRTMAQDATELAGYEPNFLMAKHASELKERRSKDRQSDGGDTAPADISEKESAYSLESTPGLLPFLDQFEFDTEGGVSGRAYGLPGIADGAMITTPAVAEVEKTVKRGYVRTEDGTVAYELGTPADDIYSSDGTAGVVTEKTRTAMLEALAGAAATMAKGEVAAAGAGLAKTVVDGDSNDMLIKLGGSTAILLAGATAMSMLSHHLTVNVFWV